MVLELYDLGLVVLGIVLFGVSILPRYASRRAISLPILFVGFGMVIFALPAASPPDPLVNGLIAERLAELGVILALMGVGLKLDRPPGLNGWRSTWRLLAITMPLSIAGAAVLGWGIVGLSIPTALLLGASIAPTDPVLASEVQVPKPTFDDQEQEIRFALTSEAGLNDGLAFPFTNLAIAIAAVGVAPSAWVADWVLIDVGYRIVIGVLAGTILGRLTATAVFAPNPETEVAESLQGLEAIAGTLLIYGATEAVGGYGFLAVFVGAIVLRSSERQHGYHRSLHRVSELAERMLMGVIMVLFGGAIVGGLLAPLTLEAGLAAVAIVFLVRPAAGFLGLYAFDVDWLDRGVIAFFGIRGIGSFYYLAYGLNEGVFADPEVLWALVGSVVLLSIVVHGISASPVIARTAGDEPGR